MEERAALQSPGVFVNAGSWERSSPALPVRVGAHRQNEEMEKNFFFFLMREREKKVFIPLEK
jgi:hypothetical protein